MHSFMLKLSTCVVLASSVIGTFLFLSKEFIGKLFINDRLVQFTELCIVIFEVSFVSFHLIVLITLCTSDVVTLVSAMIPLLVISHLLDSVLVSS